MLFRRCLCIVRSARGYLATFWTGLAPGYSLRAAWLNPRASPSPHVSPCRGASNFFLHRKPAKAQDSSLTGQEWQISVSRKFWAPGSHFTSIITRFTLPPPGKSEVRKGPVELRSRKLDPTSKGFRHGRLRCSVDSVDSHCRLAVLFS